MEKEVWKSIKGYPKYQVSNLGRVKSLSYMRTGREKVLSLKKTRCGYMTFWIYNKGLRQMKLVHRLVAEAFIPNPENKQHVNHINGDKMNNQTSNLEWCSQSENEKHAFLTGLKRKPTNKYKVLQFDQKGNLLKEWNSAKEITETLGISKSQIAKCANNQQATSQGFIWRYKKEVIKDGK